MKTKGKGIDELVEMALELKSKGLTDKDISDELSLSRDTVNWLLARKVKTEKPPADILLSWTLIGENSNRIEHISKILSDVITEEMQLQNDNSAPDGIVGIALNGIAFATYVGKELNSDLILYRPPAEKGKTGTFSSNFSPVDGKKVVLIDDVVDTGETLKGAIKALKEVGAEPALAIVIVSKLDIDNISGIPLRALITASTLS
jgi:orotate phosphoribosyltransferase